MESIDEDSVVTTNSTQGTLADNNARNNLGDSTRNVSADNAVGIWNCDGEILKETDILIR